MVKYIKISLFLFGFFLNGYILFANGNLDGNQNEFSGYFKELINNGMINPLPTLETENQEKYNFIVSFLSEDEVIKNYYYKVGILIKTNKTTERYFTMEEYKNLINSPEYKDYEFKYIEYSIYYRDVFFDKYAHWMGDPTGKCFSVLFNENDEFIERVLWK